MVQAIFLFACVPERPPREVWTECVCDDCWTTVGELPPELLDDDGLDADALDTEIISAEAAICIVEVWGESTEIYAGDFEATPWLRPYQGWGEWPVREPFMWHLAGTITTDAVSSVTGESLSHEAHMMVGATEGRCEQISDPDPGCTATNLCSQ